MRSDVQKRLALFRRAVERPSIGELLHEGSPGCVGRDGGGEDLDGDGAEGTVVALWGEEGLGGAGETHFECETEGCVGALVVE